MAVTQQVITFAYIQGKWYSFPNPAAARAAVEKYNGNMQSVRSQKPTGVNIDTSLGWNLTPLRVVFFLKLYFLLPV
jgi:hypothetical protein